MTRPPLGAANEGQPVPLSLEGGSVVDGEVQLEAAGSTTSIYPYGQFRQDVAYNDLALVNQTRSSVGTRTLTWSKELENVAKQRAVEAAVYWSHTRPNGTSCFTAFESGHGYWNASANIWYYGTYIPGENIAYSGGYLSIDDIHNNWVNSSGHYATMIRSDYRSFACAIYESHGLYYYVEAYSSKPYASSTFDRSTATGGAWVDVSDSWLSLSVSQSSNIMVVEGSSLTLDGSIPATVIGTNYSGSGLSYEVLPQNLGQFYSSNTSIARISGSNTLVGVAPGTTMVYAYVNGNTSKKVTFNATVKAKVVEATSVSLNRSSLSLTVGSSSTLTATVLPTNTADKSVTWSSSNTSVATVPSGTVKAVKPGTATITVRTANGKTATCSVTVTGISLSGATIARPSSYTYTGSAIKPTPTVTLSGKNLTAGVDFTYSYANNTNAGTATVTAIGIGNYSGSISTTFTINRKSIAIPTARDLVFTDQTQNVPVSSNENYSVSGTTGATGPGTFSTTVTLRDKTNTMWSDGTTGDKTLNWSIVKADISAATVTGVTNRTYDGSAQTQSPTVTLGGATLTKGTDYALSYSNNTNAGTATMTVTGMGIYSGTKNVTFTIARRSVAIPAAPTPEVYSDNQQSVFIAFDDYCTMSGSYSTSAVGSYPVTASLRDKANTMWSDGTTADKTLYKVITPASISDATIDTISNQTYTGSALTPEPKVTWKGKTLKKGTDYTVAYKSNTAVGTATVTITGKGNFTDTKSTTFKIVAAPKPSVASATVTGVTNRTYNGSAQTQSPTVTLGGKTLVKGTDYTLSYVGNVYAGTATMTVTGIGGYTGTKEVTFTIARKKVAIPEVKDLTYNGREQNCPITDTDEYYVSGITGSTYVDAGNRIVVSLSDKSNTMWSDGTTADKTMTWYILPKKVAVPQAKTGLTYTGSGQRGVAMGADYGLYGEELAISAGEHEAVAYLIDEENYRWSDGTTADKSITWSIAPANINTATIAKIADQTRTGKALTPEPAVTWNGKTLKKGTDYTVSYKNNTAVGTASVTVAGKGNFTGTKNTTFKIAAAPAPAAKHVAVYRLYNHKTSEHLWTTSENEYKQLPIITDGDWRQENIAWYAPDGTGEPVYRLYNKAMGDHYYSKNKNEIAVLTSRYGWTVDNNGAPAFWSALKGDEGSMPLYCLYNGKLKKGQHHFTADENERDVLVERAGWRYESIAFYGYEK